MPHIVAGRKRHAMQSVMAEEVVNAAPPAQAAPVAETPAVVVPAAVVETPAPAPVVEAAPAAETPPKVEAADTEAKPAVTEPAAVEAPPAEAEKKPEAEVKPEALKYEFKFPETVKADTAQVSAYSNILAKHNISPEAGQELVDFYGSQIKGAHDAMAQEQQDVFAQTRQGWQRDFYKQAGNRRDTILNDAKFAVGEVIKDKKEREAFWGVLNYTGVGDHPANIMAWAKVGKRLRENSAPGPGLPANAKNNERPEDRRYKSPAPRN